VVFCSSSSSDWILPKYLLLRLGLELAHHRERPERRGAAAQRDQLVAGGELLDHSQCECQVAIRGHDDAPANASWDIDRRAVGQHVDVGDQDDGVFGLDSRSRGVPGRGFLSTRRPSGKAVLNLPLKRSAAAAPVRRA